MPKQHDTRRNLCLTLEYDGTEFKGWQVQPDARTVQGELERAIERLFGVAVRTTAAGRTDAGVHALGQVANFTVDATVPLYEVERALNGLLPPDVIVRSVTAASPDFNARRHAVAREYEYRIARKRTAIQRRYAWVYRGSLDVSGMREAAHGLVGFRDFASFCVAAHERDDTHCRVTRVDLVPDDGLVLRIEANRFLRGMVRAIVGTLLQVGRGRRDAGDVDNVLAALDRGAAGPAAPPQGLYLKKVTYKHPSEGV